jgi:hypothetical protein
MPALNADLVGNTAALLCVDLKDTADQVRLLGLAGVYVPLLAARAAAYTQQLAPKLHQFVSDCNALNAADLEKRNSGVLHRRSSWTAAQPKAQLSWWRCKDMLKTQVGPLLRKIRRCITTSSYLLLRLEAAGLQGAPIFSSLRDVEQQLSELWPQPDLEQQLGIAMIQLDAGYRRWERWVTPRNRYGWW